MRKILLATTALVGIAAFAPTAQAQTKDSPLNVNIGGYVDFRAGAFTETDDILGASYANTIGNGADGERRNHDFETEFKLNIDVDGKAMRGIEYGGRVSLWNGATFSGLTRGGTTVQTADAYVYLSGAYGKVVLGDHNGASDLIVYAPTVGLGQVDGQYTNFTDPTTLTPFRPTYIENGTDYSTKVTYMTPKVGNDKHKVQLGVSYAPNSPEAGQSVFLYTSDPGGFATIGYRNLIKGALQYEGSFSPVNVVVSANMITGNGENTALTNTSLKNFTSWGLGAQLAYAGFTVGGNYQDAGSFLALTNTATGVEQNKDQHTWSAGVKYEAAKWAAAFSYLSGKGYNNAFVNSVAPTANTSAYVKDFNAYGVGGTYTWFPGMATQLDYVHFSQERADSVAGQKNAGNVVVLSQKLTF